MAGGIRRPALLEEGELEMAARRRRVSGARPHSRSTPPQRPSAVPGGVRAGRLGPARVVASFYSFSAPGSSRQEGDSASRLDLVFRAARGVRRRTQADSLTVARFNGASLAAPDRSARQGEVGSTHQSNEGDVPLDSELWLSAPLRSLFVALPDRRSPDVRLSSAGPGHSAPVPRAADTSAWQKAEGCPGNPGSGRTRSSFERSSVTGWPTPDSRRAAADPGASWRRRSPCSVGKTSLAPSVEGTRLALFRPHRGLSPAANAERDLAAVRLGGNHPFRTILARLPGTMQFRGGCVCRGLPATRRNSSPCYHSTASVKTHLRGRTFLCLVGPGS